MEITYTNRLVRQEEIYNLYERLGWNTFLKLDQTQIYNAMKNSWFVVYAFADKELVGTGRVVSDGVTNAYLCGLGVSLEYRKRGIGTEISRMLVRKCLDSNLHIQFFCEEHLVAFYNNMGFEEFAVGMRPKAVFR